MSNHDEFDTQLADQLRGRADHLDPTPVSLDRVKQTAGRIRRRRTAAVGAAFAVAMVGGGGGAMMALQSSDEPGELQVAMPAFSQVGTPTMPPSAELPVNKADRDLPGIDPSTLALGAPAELDWVQDGVLHTADGRELAVDPAYGDLYRYDDGWLAINWAGRPDGSTGQVLDAEGNEIGPTFDTDGVVAPSDDGSQLLFVAGEELVVHDNETGANQVVRDTAGETVEPVGIDDAGTVYYNLQDTKTGASDGRVWRDGAETDPTPDTEERLLAVNAQGFTTRLVDLNDFGTCSAVFDPAGTEQARTCDWLPTSFSPDGTKLLFGPAYRDGFGDLEFGIVGEDWSQPLVERVNYGSAGEQGASFQQAVWEDDEHTLVVMADHVEGTVKMTWYVVRVGIDGDAELAAEPVVAKEFNGITLVR